MDTILQGLLDRAGVGATMVFDGAGQLVGHRAHAVYDRALCEEVSGTLATAIDSIQLQQEDWESITAQFAGGKLLLRNLAVAGAGRKHVLAVVADATLNASFATLPIRVAASKLKRAIEGRAGSQPVLAAAGGTPTRPSSCASQPLSVSGVRSPPTAAPSPADSRPALASSGLSWSGASSVGSSGVTVAGPASSAFLARCAKELARHVGPISKIYVQEAVGRVSPGAPFSVTLGPQLVEDLAGQIEDAKDQASFRKALQKP